MDQLLPAPLPYLGSLLGVFVLMSASAASAQGLQNLALGLKERRYIPAAFGALNRFEVAESLRAEGLIVHTIVTGSYPARSIAKVGKREGVDLVMITSQGRGGLDLLFMGSVAQQVVQLTDSPVFILPINRELAE